MLKKQTVGIETRGCPSGSRELDEPPNEGASHITNIERWGLTSEGLIEELNKSVKDLWDLILGIIWTIPGWHSIRTALVLILEVEQ